MKVDMHVHLIPAGLERRGGPEALAPQALWDRCGRSGAERAVIQGWPFRAGEDCETQNRAVLAAMEAVQDRFFGFCAVSPADGAAAVAAAGAWLDRGFSGVGELDPARQGFSIEDPAFRDLCCLCEERGCPLCLRVEMGVGRRTDGGPLAADCLRLIEAHPGLVLLLPHYGGGLPFYALMPEVARLLGNVWFDTAPEDCALLPGAEDCTRLCLGSDHLVYGSHLPGPVWETKACLDLPEEWKELLRVC